MSERPHPLPAWVEPLCERYGMNPMGKPMYRIIWSEDRLSWQFGEQKKQYGEGRDRWILEKWHPESISESEWDAAYKEALGEYPRQGNYEHCWTFEIRVNEGEEMQYMPLREDIVTLIIRAIEAGKMRHTEAERKAALQEREDAVEKARRQMFDDLWDDSAPAPGAKIPEHIQMLDSFGAKTTADLPRVLPQRGFKQIGDLNAGNHS